MKIAFKNFLGKKNYTDKEIITFQENIKKKYYFDKDVKFSRNHFETTFAF